MTDVLLASDADWVIEEVQAALGDPDMSIRVVRTGAAVRDAVGAQTPDLVVLDLQIGNMGGMATCLDLRLEAGAGRLPHVPVLMLLDRAADVFLARRSEAEGWLVKPLDAFRLKMAAMKLLAGDTLYEEPSAEVEVDTEVGENAAAEDEAAADQADASADVA